MAVSCSWLFFIVVALLTTTNGLLVDGAIRAGILAKGPSPILDGSFNQAVLTGLQQAQADGIVSAIVTSAECLDDACLAARWADFATTERLDLVFAMGFLLAATVNASAPSYPSMKVGTVDLGWSQSDYARLTNVAGVLFKEDELGFLGGCTLGMLSPNRVAGSILGPLVPPVLRFARGIQNGFFYCCTSADCRLIDVQTSDFGSAAQGQAAAELLVNDYGAQAVAGVGGFTGSSGILRAAELGVRVVGVDSDEYYTTFAGAPLDVRDLLLTSMLKKGNVASYSLSAQVNAGQFQAGTQVFSLLLNGVDLAPCHDACSLYTPAQQQTLQLLKNQLSVGSVQTGVAGDGSFSYLSSLPDGAWLQLQAANVRPGPLLGHSACNLANATMLLFGGRDAASTPSDRLFEYDYEATAWRTLPDAGPGARPVARSEHAADVYHDALLVMGGLDAARASLGDLWLYNRTLLVWQQLPSDGGPGPRHGHSLTVVGDVAYVFGGISGTLAVVDTLHAFDLLQRRWLSLPASAGPSARAYHAAAAATPGDHRLFVHGGTLGDLSSTVSDELWSYSPADNAWLPLASGPARTRHSCSFSDGRLLLFAGLSSSLTNDVWIYSLLFNSWQSLDDAVSGNANGTLSAASAAPLPRQQHSAVRFYSTSRGKDYLLAYGGSTTGSVADDLWILGVPPPPPVEPAEFFSCSQRATFTDLTGSVQLDRAAGIFPVSYLCDDYVDCHNSYDEGYSCSPSLLGIWTGFAVVAGLLALYCAVSIGVIWAFRNHAMIRASSPVFLTIVLSGVVIGLGAMASFWGYPTRASCNLQFWLSTTAFVLVFGSLFLKSYRVFKIFSSEYRAVYMKDTQLMLFLAVLLFLAYIVCAVWSGVGDPRPRLEDEPATEGQSPRPQHEFCYSDSGQVYFWVLIGMAAAMVLVGCILAYKTRNISTIFSESSYVALSIYNFLIVGVFIIPILQLLNDNIAADILRNGAYLAWAAAPALLITAPKFWRLNEKVDITQELAKSRPGSHNSATPGATYNNTNFDASAQMTYA